MRNTKTVAYQKVVTESRTCDLCGTTSQGEDWGADNYEVKETQIIVRQRDGNAYPDGGDGMEYEIDLCPECFKNRLVPWLISEGAKIEQKEWWF